MDSTSKVLDSIRMSVGLSYPVKDFDISTNTGETQLHLTRVCVLNTTPNFEIRMWHCVEENTTQHGSANPNQDLRIAMFTNIQRHRRSERHWRTLGFKDPNVNNLVASDQTNIRRKTEFDSERD